jgi:DNA repair protein RecO (recombination protein O)
MLDACARCGEEDAAGDHELVAFDLEEGGTVCRACARGGGRPVTPDGLALLRRVLGGGLNGALAETPGPAAHEIEHLGVRALEHHVERRMRSAVLL